MDCEIFSVCVQAAEAHNKSRDLLVHIEAPAAAAWCPFQGEPDLETKKTVL